MTCSIFLDRQVVFARLEKRIAAFPLCDGLLPQPLVFQLFLQLLLLILLYVK
jgi:hypothetical protein